MDNFDEARVYDSNSTEQREDGLNLMDLLCLEEGSKVLDIGCGSGYLTQVLANRVGPKGKVYSYTYKEFWGVFSKSRCVNVPLTTDSYIHCSIANDKANNKLEF